MGRMVYCPITSESIGTSSAGDDIFELVAGANNKLRLHGFEIYSNQVTAEALSLRLLRRSTTGTGGTAETEVKADEDDGAITAALTANVTTPGTPGDVLAHFEWEQLGPLVYWPTPMTQPMVQEGGRLCLELIDAPAATQVVQGYVVWEEI